MAPIWFIPNGSHMWFDIWVPSRDNLGFIRPDVQICEIWDPFPMLAGIMLKG